MVAPEEAWSRYLMSVTPSPLTYIDANDPPVLIIHGEKDDMVPPVQSRLLLSQLQQHGVKCELMVVPGAPHYGIMFDAWGDFATAGGVGGGWRDEITFGQHVVGCISTP